MEDVANAGYEHNTLTQSNTEVGEMNARWLEEEIYISNFIVTKQN